ncbi:hypothetical protein JXO52_05735 [bacterium]|nr:hypothetical protein [bacterium]
MQRSFFDLVQQIKKKCTVTERQIQDELNLTQAEFGALRLIQPGESLQNGVFSDKMGLSVSRGSRVINQLRKKGFVVIKPVPQNRRCHEISLTRSGEAVQARINDRILSCENSFLEHLPAQMRVQVFDNLEYILEIMEGNNYRV